MKAMTFLMLLPLLAAPALAQTEAATAYAAPLKGITVDGELDDWPRDLVRYPLLISSRIYGDTDLELTDLQRGNDCAASLAVGYDAAEGLIYVAVTVRDETHVVPRGDEDGDAVEVYIDGSLGRARENDHAIALQYHGVAGEGQYNTAGNPGLFQHDIKQTRARFAYSRANDTTIYEWAIQAFDHFPDEPSELRPGKRMNFDVVVIDKDAAEDPTAFVPWGALAGWKFFNSDRLGSLVLLGEDDAQCRVSGRVVDAGDGKPRAGLILEARELPGAPAGVAVTDDDGRYEFRLPEGDYTLRQAPWQGMASRDAFRVSARAGVETRMNLALPAARLPDPLLRSLAAYRALKSYRDNTLVRVRSGTGDDEVGLGAAMNVSFERPNRLRIESDAELLGKPLLVCDGGRSRFQLRAGAYSLERPGPPALTPITLRRLMAERGHYWGFGSVAGRAEQSFPAGQFHRGSVQGAASLPGLHAAAYAHRLMLSPDPEAEVRLGLGESRLIGRDWIGEEAVSVVELVKRGVYALPAMFPCGPGVGEPVTLRLWISDRDHLIRRSEFEIDAQVLAEGPGRGGKPAQPVRYTVEHRDVKVNPELEASVFEVAR